MIAELLSSWIPSFGDRHSPAIRPRASLENPAMSLNDPKTWDGVLGGTETESGEKVSHDTALELAAVWQAVDLISGDVAGLTLNIYKRIGPDDREIDNRHPAQFLVSEVWNEETGSYEGWRRIMVHAPLWGNGYAWIEREGGLDGEPTGLYNLLPDRTCPMRNKKRGEPFYVDGIEEGDLYYITEVDGKLEALHRKEVLHVKGMSIQNEKALDLVHYARNTIGLGLSAVNYTSKFFKHGAITAGILELPSTMSDPAKDNLASEFPKRYTSKDNWFKTIVLRDGAKFHPLTIDASRAQTNETRDQQRRDVAAFFGMQPSMLGVRDSVSYNSAEMARLAYLQSCLVHWLRAITDACKMKLLTERQRRRMSHYFEHNMSNFIEIDTMTQNQVLALQRTMEFINANEARRKLNMSPRTDPEAEDYINPNTRSKLQQQQEAAATQPSDRLVEGIKNVFTDAAGRMARRVCADVKNMAKKPARLLQWLDGEGPDHQKVFDEVMGPVLAPIAAATNQLENPLLTMLRKLFSEELNDRIAPLVEPPHKQEDLAANVEQACNAFEQGIAGRMLEKAFGGK